jgi:hypothetical protein
MTRTALGLLSLVALASAQIVWRTTTSLPRPSWRHACAVGGDRVYFIGGGEGPYADCWLNKPNPDGTLGDWLATESLPVALGWHSADATRNHVYVCGGWNSSGLTSDVLYARIDSSGAIGEWQDGGDLPSPLYTHGALIIDSCLYVVGGATGIGGPTVADVWYAAIQSDGTLAGWTATQPLPAPRRIMGLAVLDTFLYCVGGRDGSGAATSSVWFAPRHGDGSLGPWQTTLLLPAATDGGTGCADNNRIYSVSGTRPEHVYSARMESAGALKFWDLETALPATRWAADGLAAGDRIYVFGGYDGGPSADVYYSSLLTSVEERASPRAAAVVPATLNHGSLFLPASGAERGAAGVLLDLCGRCVMALRPGRNDVSQLTAGVYYLRAVAGREPGPRSLVIVK